MHPMHGRVVQPLRAARAKPASLHGTALIGLDMQGTLADGTPISMRIDDVIPVDADITYYRVSYLTGGAWLPLCGLNLDLSPVNVVMVAGTWDATGAHLTSDPSQITLACEKSTVGKCLMLGYKPWKSVTSGDQEVSLAAPFDSCVRMIRADYC